MPFDPATDPSTAAAYAKEVAALTSSSTPERKAPTIDQLAEKLGNAVLSSPALMAKEVPQRPKLLGEWLREGDLGFIFAARGVGKTWISMLVANAISDGTALGHWTQADAPRAVLYVDGEMNLPDSQQRANLIGIRSERFQWIHHEHLFDVSEMSLDLGLLDHQQAISRNVEAGSVLILDNLSSLCRGVDENDNDAWETILPWLLELRRRSVTVIIVHHAGRNGQMRGASRREDAAHWILRIADDSGDSAGKALITTFAKCRNCGPEATPPLRWTLHFGQSLTYTCDRHSGPDAMLSLIGQGVESASELAEELNVSKGAVSKWAKKLAAEGRITITSRAYKLKEADAPTDQKRRADLND
jgi:RecA-family ATPase/biotin operon repressor